MYYSTQSDTHYDTPTDVGVLASLDLGFQVEYHSTLLFTNTTLGDTSGLLQFSAMALRYVTFQKRSAQKIEVSLNFNSISLGKYLAVREHESCFLSFL